MKDTNIKLTPVSEIVAKTKALPEIPNGAHPVVYEQVIPNASIKADRSYGKPDPAHYMD